MVGVCIMVISIVKSMGSGLANYLVDKALAIDSLLFMISALLSFSSIRLKQSTELLGTFRALGENDLLTWLGINDADYGNFLF